MNALNDLDLSKFDSDPRELACAASINESSGFGASVASPQAVHHTQAPAPMVAATRATDQLEVSLRVTKRPAGGPLLPSVSGVNEVRLHAGTQAHASSLTQCKGAAAYAIDGFAMPGNATNEIPGCMEVLDDLEREELERETPGLLVVGLDSLPFSDQSRRQLDEHSKRIENAPSDDAGIYINVSRFMDALDDLDLSELNSDPGDLACAAGINESSGLGASVASPQSVPPTQAAAPRVAATQASKRSGVPLEARKRPAGDLLSSVGSVDEAHSQACRTVDGHNSIGPAGMAFRKAGAFGDRSPRSAQGLGGPATRDMPPVFANRGSHAALRTNPQQHGQGPSSAHRLRGSPSGLLDDDSFRPIAAHGPGAQNALETGKGQKAKKQQAMLLIPSVVQQRLQEALLSPAHSTTYAWLRRYINLNNLTDIVCSALSANVRGRILRLSTSCRQSYIDSRVKGKWPEMAAILKEVYPAVDWAYVDELVLPRREVQMLRARLGPPLVLKEILWQELLNMVVEEPFDTEFIPRVKSSNVLKAVFNGLNKRLPPPNMWWDSCSARTVVRRLMRWAADGRWARLKSLVQHHQPDLYQQLDWCIVENWLSIQTPSKI